MIPGWLPAVRGVHCHLWSWGGLNTRHASHLTARYKEKAQIRFVGAIYDYEELSGLRKHCALYFIGGTTPSLLEAMACEEPWWLRMTIRSIGVCWGSQLFGAEVSSAVANRSNNPKQVRDLRSHRRRTQAPVPGVGEA